MRINRLVIFITMVTLLMSKGVWQNRTHVEPTAIRVNTNGTYVGKGNGHNPSMPITVEVTMKDDRIKKIEVLSHGDTPYLFALAENEIIRDVIEANSVEVDLVAGSTKSSRGLLKAIRAALAKAKP